VLYIDKTGKISEMALLEKSLRNLRVADLELFITAAHMKHLGRSANLHNLSQSAASAAVQRVEAALGVSLCTHKKRQFELTRKGSLLIPRLEQWIKELQYIISADEQVPIRFVTTHAIAQVAVPALFSLGNIEFKHMRPDHAYAAILHDEADVALVLDNAPWKGVVSAQVGEGSFQLYSSNMDVPISPVLLPEDQMEVLSLQQSWQQVHDSSLPIKARIPSWSLIASICDRSSEVGFLPDFLAKKLHLHPVLWQPSTSPYRVLAIYRNAGGRQQSSIDAILGELRSVFALL
jgi:DNA-binding transcriptional LysR family regulator